MFRIDMLPAAHGDCLWLEFGDTGSPRRVLIDGGTSHTYKHLFERLNRLAPTDRHFELFVITHIDADHIEGAIRLLRDAANLGVTFARIWFNGQAQLDKVPKVGQMLGAVQGEYLSLLITDLEEASGKPLLNVGLGDPGDFVGVVGEPLVLPHIELAGGLSLTVLSPDIQRLRNLALEWDKVLAEFDIGQGSDGDAIFRHKLQQAKRLRGMTEPATGRGAPEPEEEPDDAPALEPKRSRGPMLGDSDRSLGSDTSPANGSSIALLAEHADGSALLSGDAFAPVLAASIQQLLADRGKSRLKIDAFKLPHHGSAANLSLELLELLSAKHYLISTNGASFGHPHDLTIDTLIEHHNGRGKPQLHFNYHSASTGPWAPKATQKSGGFVSHYPMGTSLDLSS